MSVPKQPLYEAVPSTTDYDTGANERSVTEQYVVDSNSDGEQHHKAATVTSQPSQPLHISWIHRCARLGLDLVVAFLALLFTVFGLVVHWFDGRPAEPGSVGYKLVEISQYGPTIFPVLFAAIASASLKSVATWHVQSSKGASIGVLEQCLGSQTISRAITTQINLRAFNLLAVAIIVIWCLSPLGSQASLRVVSIVPNYTSVETPLTALKTFSQYTYGSVIDYQWSLTTIGSSMIASMMAAKLLDTRNQDIWGNVRFPAIESFEAKGIMDWIKIQDGQNVTYPSLAGVPVSILPPRGNTSFTLSGSYLSVSCPIFGPKDDYGNFTRDLPSQKGFTSDNQNCFYVADRVPEFQLAITSRCWGMPSSQGQSREARILLWESLRSPTVNLLDPPVTRAECILTTTYVETNMTCTGSRSGKISESICSPSAVRLSPNPPADRNITVFDKEGNLYDIGGLVKILGLLFPDSYESGASSPLRVYFTNPYTAVTGDDEGHMHEVITRETFELRMAQLLNTMAYIGINMTAVTGTFDGTESKDGTLLRFTGTTTVGQDVVRCNRVWLGLLTIASLVAFVFAVAGAVLRLFTLTPDMLGSTAIAFLDHKLGEVKGSSTWSSDEWVRYHRNAKLRLGDVEPEAEVGRIALAAVEGEAVRPVEKGRYYT